MKSLLLKRILLIIFVVGFLSGCSITPRYHSFGYNVEWKTANHRSTKLAKPKRSSPPANFGAHVTNSVEFESNILRTNHPAIDTGSTPSDSVEPNVVKKQTMDPEMRRVNSRIGVTNFLLLADAVSTPLLIRKNRDTDSVGFIIYTLLIAPFIFLLLLIRRIALGRKRKKLKNTHAFYENNTRIVPQAISEKSTIRHQRTNAKSDPVEDIIEIIALILTIILGSSSFGGRISTKKRSSGGRGGHVDTTVFWVIASVVIAAAGIVAAIALKGVFKPSNYTNILILPFTLFGVPSGLIGLIKSIRDRYDLGKYLSIGDFAMLAIMWVIAGV